MSSYDARPSGCTPFEEELVKSMNTFANSAEAPAFDTTGMVHRTRRRRATVVAGIATTLIVAGGGTALASMTGGSHTPAKSVATATATDHKKATLVLDDHEGLVIPIDLTGVDLATAKGQLLKAQLKLGTVVKGIAVGCKSASVIEVSPHSPKTVDKGDTVNVTLCAG